MSQPLVRTLPRWQVLTTLGVLGLATATTLLTILRPAVYHDEAALVQQYLVQDATILAAGVPVLAAGLWFAMRGSIRGRLLWLGGLAYMAYIWTSVGLQVDFNVLFLAYAALVTLSVVTLVGGLLRTDAETVRNALEGRISPRAYGTIVVVIGAGLAALWLSELVPAVLADEPPQIVADLGQQALVSHFVDLALVVPTLVIAGVWLRQGRPWGYALSGVLLVMGSLLAVSITATTVVIAEGETVALTTPVLVLTMVPIALAAGLAIRYLLAIDESGTRRGDGRRTDEHLA